MASSVSRPLIALALVVLSCVPRILAQSSGGSTPRAELVLSTPVKLTGSVDSNSPAIWQRVAGRNTFFVMTSTAGMPSTAAGRSVGQLGAARPIALDPWPGGGVWMEAVVADVDGTWYGYYHNENVAVDCRGSAKVIPRIGAARSRDRGATWEPLGIVLEAPPGSDDCLTNNVYFVGGVGDFSVQLDPNSQDLYFFFSQYVRAARLQGVSVARLAWADRDAPAGKIMVWQTRRWVPASSSEDADGIQRVSYPLSVPIMTAAEQWHDDDTVVDAFWGPAVHWNTYLNQYVMLLNHAKDAGFAQEGIYVSFAPRIDDPKLWTTPVKILDGGEWYPQVIGLDDGSGTDKVAGQVARFFMGGTSEHLIRFFR